MSDESLVEKIRRINQEKEEEHRNVICQKERSTTHFRIANPTPFQVQSSDSSSDYNIKRSRIKITLWTSLCTRSDTEKWLCFLRKHGISRP
jgi:Fe2+ or Zn2+ uptake regulation protein